MSKLTHSVDWVVLLKDGVGHYPCMSTAARSGMGLLVASGLMYPDAHEEADRLNRIAKIVAPRYTPEEGP